MRNSLEKYIKKYATSFLSATAVFAQNELRKIPFDLEEQDGLNLMYSGKADLYFALLALTPSRFRYLRPTATFWFEPLYYILGSKYPKNYDFSEKFFQMTHTFDLAVSLMIKTYYF